MEVIMNKEELEKNLLELSKQIAHNNILLKTILMYLLGEKDGRKQIISCYHQIEKAYNKIVNGDNNE